MLERKRVLRPTGVAEEDGRRLLLYEHGRTGETFVVTRRGVPVAEIRPVTSNRQTWVHRSYVLGSTTTGSHIDRAQFRADLDALVDQSL